MAATLMRWLLATDAPGSTVLVRLMVGRVFLAEGSQKFLYRVNSGWLVLGGALVGIIASAVFLAG